MCVMSTIKSYDGLDTHVGYEHTATIEFDKDKEEELKRTRVVIFHHNDMDGITAAEIVARKVGPGRGLKMVELNHSADDRTKLLDPENVDENTTVYIVDYSFTKNNVELLAQVKNNAKLVVWIDHHDSSIDVVKNRLLAPYKMNDKLTYLISKKGSGAYLAWLYMCPGEPVPYFVELVSDYDTFTLANPESSYFLMAYRMATSKHEFIKSCLLDWTRESAATVDKAIEKGKILKTFIDSDNASVIKVQGYESFLPYLQNQTPVQIPVYVCNRYSNSWVFGEKYHEYKYCITWYFDGKEYRYSIFSDLKTFPDADCGHFAVQFGGGGHKGAAGWRSKNLMFFDGAFVPYRSE